MSDFYFNRSSSKMSVTNRGELISKWNKKRAGKYHKF